MEYKGYLIEQDKTGYAPKDSKFHFYISGDEIVRGWGESLEDCIKQIDELLYENHKTTIRRTTTIPVSKC